MSKVIKAPFGSWDSPLTTDKVVEKSASLGEVKVSENGEIYFLEFRPTDKGRTVLVKLENGEKQDITPSPYNIRTRLHEYGGSSILFSDNCYYFSEFSDQRIYRHDLGSKPVPITPEKPWRFANFTLDKSRNLLFSIMEDHSESSHEPENCIAKINLSTGQVEKILTGYDFYSSPALSNDGKRLAYFCWNHPQMPWDGNELWVADLDENGEVLNRTLITGGKRESTFQPEWSSDGSLYYVTDKQNGWWNLYRNDFTTEKNLYPIEAEFGRPQWKIGDKSFLIIDENLTIFTFNLKGTWKIGLMDKRKETPRVFDSVISSFSSLNYHNGKIIFLGASPVDSPAIFSLDIDSGEFEKLFALEKIPIEKEFISVPEALEFPTDGGETAHAFFYPPCNPGYEGLDKELPPLVVMSHGGPTACASNILAIATQFWTTRGFAVVDVNYGGSTGYGREYRERLHGNWGVVDMHDCENAAQYLAQKGLIDKNRIAIRGGSAGGYSTLCALTFLNSFHVGASYFGVSNLEALARDTHKFEARYCDSMVGPYPEAKEIYYKRSPINFTEKLSCPVIFFQGLEDKVVPPNQAEEMYKKLIEKNLPTAYMAYPGEAHGFREAANIKHSLETELYFYSRVFNFEPAGNIAKIEIRNLK